jgi:hypothetical protein
VNVLLSNAHNYSRSSRYTTRLHHRGLWLIAKGRCWCWAASWPSSHLCISATNMIFPCGCVRSVWPTRLARPVHKSRPHSLLFQIIAFSSSPSSPFQHMPNALETRIPNHRPDRQHKQRVECPCDARCINTKFVKCHVALRRKRI